MASRRLQFATRFCERHARQPPRRSGFGTQDRPHSLACDPLGRPGTFLRVIGVGGRNEMRFLPAVETDVVTDIMRYTARPGGPAWV